MSPTRSLPKQTLPLAHYTLAMTPLDAHAALVARLRSRLAAALPRTPPDVLDELAQVAASAVAAALADELRARVELPPEPGE